MKTTTKQHKEMAVNREAKEPAIAKAVRERTRNTADGDFHAVRHTVHATRKQEVVASKEVAKPAKRRWQRASLLPAMEDPAGKHCEYVRRDNRNRGDCANLTAHLRSGWEICRASHFDIAHLPTLQIAGYGEVIGNDDTVLMMIDEDMWAERQAYYDAGRDATTRAINDPNVELDVSHPHMPLTDVKNQTESTMERMRGRRRRASVAPD